jgi:predicted aspartyl protease
MLRNLSLAVPYDTVPLVTFVVRSEDTGRSLETQVLIDTGADATILDELVATTLGIDLARQPTVNVMGIGGRVTDARVAQIVIDVHGSSNISAAVYAVFVPQASSTFGNLLGLDFLESVDFGLSHGERLAYFGLPA